MTVSNCLVNECKYNVSSFLVKCLSAIIILLLQFNMLHYQGWYERTVVWNSVIILSIVLRFGSLRRNDDKVQKHVYKESQGHGWPSIKHNPQT